MQDDARTISPLLDALHCLADDTRLRLLRLLERHELGVGELAQVLRLPQPTISRHLKELSDCGFVHSRREGTSNLYRLRTAELPPVAAELWAVAKARTDGWVELEQDNRRLSALLAEKASATRRFFAGAAEQWDKLRDELYGPTFSIDALLALLPDDAVVADLGCGTASLARRLAPFIRKVIAVDNSPEMLAAARSRCADLPNVDVQAGELSALPLETASCHGALLVLALTYAHQPEAVIAEAARILRPAGTLVLVDLLPHTRNDFQHDFNQLHPGFDLERVKGWCTSAGLSVRRARPIPPPLNAKGPALFLTSARKPG
ncbi:MAG: ArsR/SmtB family transcription factor [Tepidisphaerales bacterium]